MPSERRSLIKGTRLRATRIDECGDVDYGDCAYIVSRCFASVAMTVNEEAPSEYKAQTAGGDFCVNQRDRPQLNWIEVTATLLQVDPELVEMLTGSPIVYDDSAIPVAVGFQTDSAAYATSNFALELWTDLGRPVGDPACTAAGTRYGYLLLPWMLQGTVGDITIENGVANLVLAAITADGNQWGAGPYAVVDDVNGDPVDLLDPIASTVHRHIQFTGVAPPAVTDGCQPLVQIS